MSLKHILNDDPTPGPSPHISAPIPTVVSTSVIDPALMRDSPSSSNTMSPAPPAQQRYATSSTPPDPEQPPAFRTESYQSGPHPRESQKQHSYQYVPPQGEYDYLEQDDSLPPSPTLSNDGPASATRSKDYAESNGRRKRKHAEDDDDYTPPGQKRQTRRSARMRLHNRTQTPASSETQDDPPLKEEYPDQIEEEVKLNSSDLEECEELWIGELGNYIMETRKRQKQVDEWFSRWVIERDSLTAYHMSHTYRDRIARIPLPPPPAPPAPPPPVVPYEVEEALMRPPSPSVGGYEMVHDDFTRPPPYSGEPVHSNWEHVQPPMSRKRGKGKKVDKPVPSAASDSGSEDIPISTKIGQSKGPANKRRKLDGDMGSVADEFTGEDGPIGPPPAHKLVTSARGKGKGKAREQSVDSVSTPLKGRKKLGPRKKLDTLPPHTQELLGVGSASASVAGDITPSASRPASPALTNASATLFELDEAIPPLKRARRVDEASMLKRVRALEEAQRKVWMNIARRDVVKVYKYHSQGRVAREQQCKRIATTCVMHVRRPYTRTTKSQKDVQAKGKRLMREMLVFWKKNEKEERDVRRREHREALDRAKVEEEKREATRQARKLEFLISQTELYSHFVGNKLKTAELEGDGAQVAVPAGAQIEDMDEAELQDLNFDAEDETNIHRHARANAQAAIALAKRRAQDFDTQAALERKTNEALKLAKQQAHIRGDESVEGLGTAPGSAAPATPLVDLDSDELNFQNPTSLSGELTIKQPNMLMATLKEYQLKGLNWLATLYEQGINGILADEMGLGKTVQSISLLAYLAETHDIWGPFLVVSPASTLHNWQQEITRFVPKLKALPYWGNVKDRATLRKFWNKKEISYDEDAPFHVLITSYQLVTQDQQYFQRVKWQYMILDEAQNIKNSSSARWKTLLGFQCRNRLLLTGTPIQNSMQELWALLHFIMPSLFDSHDEFNEWFSKDIENAAENKGSKLNEHQLRRLHMILKPFMLRRVKRHVQNELSDKIEVDIYVELSARQRAMYKALLANVSVADLLEKAANIGDADSARSLMNLVMQFRKVCNHPELFERADVVAPFSFSDFGRPGPLNREGDFVLMPYSTRNPIELALPTLLYNNGGIVDVLKEDDAKDTRRLETLMNIWSTDHIYRSAYEEDSAFAFLKFLNASPSEVHQIYRTPLILRQLATLAQNAHRLENEPFASDPDFVASDTSSPFLIASHVPFGTLDRGSDLPAVREISKIAWQSSCLSRRDIKLFVPPVVAPPISVYSADRTFMERQATIMESPLESLALYGLPPTLWESDEACSQYQERMSGLPVSGLFGASSPDQLPLSTMQVPEAKRLIYDSGKLARLDALLQELKAGDHKVLVYFQMTKMMDLMEEYLIYRQYKYLRLDGSSKLEDRRDMVMEWQTRPDIFVFILSTRAGGLGINLTAADTVVFYDHDWNPSNDAQAMDRAHRLGQTRQVTVYRLITKGTIDERIVQLARVKKDVQDIVVGNKTFTDVAKPNEIVSLLLNDDELANLKNNGDASAGTNKDIAGVTANGSVRDLWNEEGDEFFGQAGSGQTGTATPAEGGDEDVPPAPAKRGRKRGPRDPNAPRRKPGPKKKVAIADADS